MHVKIHACVFVRMARRLKGPCLGDSIISCVTDETVPVGALICSLRLSSSHAVSAVQRLCAKLCTFLYSDAHR